MKKVLIVLGTRPEIIKFSPIIPLLDSEFKTVVVHTNQHYSANLDDIFFQELKLRKPDYNLDVGSGTHAEQTAKILVKLEALMLKEKPDIVLVQGDTNSTLGGGLVAAKLDVKLGHVEAGCRSFNRAEPEEINRLVVDRVATILFVPDKYAYENLVKEGISKENMFITGSTVVDACNRSIKIADEKIIDKLGLKKGEYVLVTVHRASNTNDEGNLRSIIGAINRISERIKVVFPIHPRTKKFLKMYDLKLSDNVVNIEATGYLEFLKLLENSRFVMTDAGGVQEEAVILNIPCLILNYDTAWMEFVEAKKTFLVGAKKEEILKKAVTLIEDEGELRRVKERKFELSGGASQKIFKILKEVI